MSPGPKRTKRTKRGLYSGGRPQNAKTHKTQAHPKRQNAKTPKRTVGANPIRMRAGDLQWARWAVERSLGTLRSPSRRHFLGGALTAMAYTAEQHTRRTALRRSEPQPAKARAQRTPRHLKSHAPNVPRATLPPRHERRSHSAPSPHTSPALRREALRARPCATRA